MQKTYTLIRSKRKTIALEINKSLEIIVRAPARMPKVAVDDFVRRHAGWIDSHMDIIQKRIAAAGPEPTPLEIEALRARARNEIPPRVTHYATLMGVTPTAVKITSAKTRFGSCSGRNSLCFSLYLMRYPQAAIDYVVVHELAHIVYKNHGQAFYALIASILPDYKQRRALLKGGDGYADSD